MSPQALAEILSSMFSVMDILSEKHGVQKIKTIGDAYMAVSGIAAVSHVFYMESKEMKYGNRVK